MNKQIVCKDVFGNEYEVDADRLEQRVGVYAVIIKGGKILLTRQWDGYSLVGGGVDKGETLEDGIIREVKEETGLDMTPGKLIYQVTTFFKRNEQATPCQSFQFYFTHDKLSGEIDNNNITMSEKTYTNNAPEWINLNDVETINFRHSVDLMTILNAYNKG